MHEFTPTKIVKKSMVGRPCDYMGSDGVVYNGRIDGIKRGKFVTVFYHVPGKKGEFRTIVFTREKRLEVY